jgi:hypothetical protein
MGRYDALTLLDKKTARPQTALAAKPQEDKAARPQTDKQVSPQVALTARPQTATSPREKPERYTVRMLPSLQKKIKLFAVEHDMDDYEVVQEAVKEYIQKK